MIAPAIMRTLALWKRRGLAASERQWFSGFLPVGICFAASLGLSNAAYLCAPNLGMLHLN